MSKHFKDFAAIVNAAFVAATNGGDTNPFVADVEPDALWEAYLSAFPEGTNPIYRERREHDCTCCRQFIRHVGHVVAMHRETGAILTVWDDAAERAPHPYNLVAAALRDMVRGAFFKDVFLVTEKEPSFGSASTRADDAERGVVTWNHLYTGPINRTLMSSSVDMLRGSTRTSVSMFKQAAAEMTDEALGTVIELIDMNSLYKGKEKEKAIRGFIEARKQYLSLTGVEADRFAWRIADNKAVSRFRGDVLAELVKNLSKGEDIEVAVGAYTKMVDPANYQKTNQIITPGMVKAAMATIQELELEQSLERRFARLDDISVNDVLWVDRSTRSKMKGGLGDMLMSQATKSVESKIDESKAEAISIDKFLLDVVPKATSMEALLKGRHLANFVSLTAPVHPEPKQLFKWNNDFAWRYTGNLADSALRKAVEDKGGRVDGAFRFSHSWNYGKRNASLMDLHVFMPGWNQANSNSRDSYGDYYGNHHRVGWNNRQHPMSGGIQDVDYTAVAPEGYVPVENITFPEVRRMQSGEYICRIHNWNLRQPTVGGFKAEIEFEGQVFEYEYDKPLGHKEWVTVAIVTLLDGKFSIDHKLPCTSSAKEKWGMQTEQFNKISAITLSPNCWGGEAIGNKHTIFVIDGAKSDEPTRGIFNEFLHSRLQQHRKVFDVIGEKTKCPPADEQVSGVGFSETQKASIIVRAQVDGRQRLFSVQFGGA